MMKRITSIGVVLLSLLYACENKFGSGEYLPSDLEYNDSINIPSTEIGKRGIYLRQTGGDWSAKVSSTRAHWHYSESNRLSIKEPGNIDFVPMVKDTADLGSDDIEALNKMKDNGQLRYIIGFNEPDNPEKANMSVADAIALWPQLEQFGVPLTSPLCVDAEGTWMNDFMTQASNSGLQVDFVALQWSGEYDVDGFLDMLDRVYSKYQKPIWITKFTLVNARLTEVSDFLESVLPELDSRDYIFRYAWSSGEVNTPTAFWDLEGNLTTRGQYYADFYPNDYLSLGRDDWIDISSLVNLVVDGGFESGTLDAWGGYGTAVVTGDAAYSGDYAGMAGITGWSSGSAINYPLIIVEPLNTYYISFAARLTSEITAPAGFEGVRMLVRDPVDNTIRYFQADPVSSTEWKEYAYQVDIPEGVTEIMLVCWRPQKSPEFVIDDLFVAKIE